MCINLYFYFGTVPYLCGVTILTLQDMKKNEEYVENRSRDWLMFGISTIAMFGFLFFLPEWIWVIWPFQLTGLAGALGRL
jgi:hypothetical protein